MKIDASSIETSYQSLLSKYNNYKSTRPESVISFCDYVSNAGVKVDIEDILTRWERDMEKEGGDGKAESTLSTSKHFENDQYIIFQSDGRVDDDDFLTADRDYTVFDKTSGQVKSIKDMVDNDNDDTTPYQGTGDNAFRQFVGNQGWISRGDIATYNDDVKFSKGDYTLVEYDMGVSSNSDINKKYENGNVKFDSIDLGTTNGRDHVNQILQEYIQDMGGIVSLQDVLGYGDNDLSYLSNGTTAQLIQGGNKYQIKYIEGSGIAITLLEKGIKPIAIMDYQV